MAIMKIQNNIVQYLSVENILSKAIIISTCIFMYLLLVNPVSAQIINGDFETGDLSGWSAGGLHTNVYRYDTDYVGIPPETSAHSGDYIVILGDTMEGGAYIEQWVDLTDAELLTFWVHYNEFGGDFDLYIDGIYQYNVNGLAGWIEYSANVSDMSGSTLIKFYMSSDGLVLLDDISTSYTQPSITLLEFDKEPYTEYDLVTLNWDLSEYYNTHANEKFTLQITENGTIHEYPYQTNKSLKAYGYGMPTGSYEHQLYYLLNSSINGTISAQIYYSYADPVYTGGFILESYIITDILDDGVEPPEPPENPPEEPPEEPIQGSPSNPETPEEPEEPRGTNTSINMSWTGGYYIRVNNTADMLFNPVYNFTSYSLYPITYLNDSIADFNIIMDNNFNESKNSIDILRSPIMIIVNSIHPKIISVISYYLIWLIVLIILKKR